MAKIKKKKIPVCDICKDVSNPRFRIIDHKTDEVVRKLCKQCASNIEAALKFFIDCERRRERIHNHIIEEDIPY